MVSAEDFRVRKAPERECYWVLQREGQANPVALLRVWPWCSPLNCRYSGAVALGGCQVRDAAAGPGDETFDRRADQMWAFELEHVTGVRNAD